MYKQKNRISFFLYKFVSWSYVTLQICSTELLDLLQCVHACIKNTRTCINHQESISDHCTLTHAEKSLLIAERIFPMAVELHALPLGQCFIVSFIYHSTLHTDVMVSWHVESACRL